MLGSVHEASITFKSLGDLDCLLTTQLCQWGLSGTVQQIFPLTNLYIALSLGTVDKITRFLVLIGF